MLRSVQEATEALSHVEVDPEGAPEDRFSARVRELREALGWSQAELARRVGVDSTAITKLERRTRSVRLNEAAKLAAVLGSTVDHMTRASIDKRDLTRMVKDYMGELWVISANATAEWKHQKALLDELSERFEGGGDGEHQAPA